MSHWEIQIITDPISASELKALAADGFGDFIKAVVDLEQSIMAVGGNLHADEEAVLLEHGSRQQDLWGINIYPEAIFPDMIEFDSMINIRPHQNNRSRDIEDLVVREKIMVVVKKLILL